MAIVYVLGESIAANETGFPMRLLLAMCLAAFFLEGVIRKRLSLLSLTLLLFLAAGGALRYHMEETAITIHRNNIERFQDFNVSLCGHVENNHYSNEKSRILLSGTLLSSAYGSPASLSEGAPPGLLQKYSQPSGRIMIYIDGRQDLYPGQYVIAYGKMVPESRPTNEGQFDFSLYYRSQGIHGCMYGDKIVILDPEARPWAAFLQEIRNRMAESLRSACPPEDNGLFQAILLGNKTEMDKKIQSLFRKNGIAHILAISGLHLSIIGNGFYGLLRSAGMTAAPAGILAGFLILAYGILSGASGSAIRAVIMLLLRFLAIAIGRTSDTLSSLAASCIILLVWRPFLLFSSGFQMSFLAVLALGLFSELELPFKGPFEGIWKTLAGSLFLQLFTLPITLYHYYLLPLYSLPLNFAVLPLMSCVIFSGLGALLLSFLPLPPPLRLFLPRMAIGSGHYILRFYTWLCSLAEKLPFAILCPGRPQKTTIFVYYAVFLALYALLDAFLREHQCRECVIPENNTFLSSEIKMKKMKATSLRQAMESQTTLKMQSFRKRAIIALTLPFFITLLLMLFPRADKKLSITALDVGQGDGFIIRFDGKVITIDNGSTSNNSFGEGILEPYLLSQGITSIDCAIITHCDKDHYSGMLWIMEESENVRVRQICLPSCARNDKRYRPLTESAEKHGTTIEYLARGNCLSLGTMRSGNEDALLLNCLYPEGSEYIEEANSHSIGILLSYKKFQMLFTGDLPKEKEGVLIQALLDLQNEIVTREINKNKNKNKNKNENENRFADTENRNKNRSENVSINKNNVRRKSCTRTIEILKAGHHGSSTSTSGELLDTLKASCALLSYGKNNRYGHPHRETMNALENYNITCYETAILGEIRIWSNGLEYAVLTPMSQ